jgi:acetoin utilization protein AcuB
MNDAIENFMTLSVHMIGAKSPLTEAHRMMNEHAIRHLPVLEGGRLVGMLSQRDLHLIETIKDVVPKEVLVEEAMSQDAYTVAPEASLKEVARVMGLHKYGSAVVIRGSQVLGIFTTTDALRALDTVLGGMKKAGARKAAKPVSRTAKRKASARRPAVRAPKSSKRSTRR